MGNSSAFYLRGQQCCNATSTSSLGVTLLSGLDLRRTIHVALINRNTIHPHHTHGHWHLAPHSDFWALLTLSREREFEVPGHTTPGWYITLAASRQAGTSYSPSRHAHIVCIHTVFVTLPVRFAALDIPFYAILLLGNGLAGRTVLIVYVPEPPARPSQGGRE